MKIGHKSIITFLDSRLARWIALDQWYNIDAWEILNVIEPACSSLIEFHNNLFNEIYTWNKQLIVTNAN